MKRIRILALLPLFALLGGCNLVVLDPAGTVASRQSDLLIESTGLMLLIIVPVIALTLFFAWHYRASNTKATYAPEWDHSTQLELVIWGAPLLIIICLGAMTWMGTHLLDPFRPIDAAATQRANGDANAPADANAHLEVDVVALDWKWLFIYPQYGVATLNQLAAPANRTIDFHITSSSVMNSFSIPALAGQIYAMPGMETTLYAVMNRTGTYDGFSANYSGAGFSGMHFPFESLASGDFDKWIAKAKADGGALSRSDYLQLEKPSENEPARSYASVETGLFNAILNECVEPGKMCLNEMAAIDERGGLGLAGINNVFPLEYDKEARRGAFGPDASYVASLCDPKHPMGMTAAAAGAAQASPAAPSLANGAPLRGAALPRPPFATFLGPPTPERPTSTSLPAPEPQTPAPPSRPSNT
ncbi:MAG TPA: ubiquinol oxidase subunit II [Xanthobacteraceae bacterium]|nr:ubiquinol oxidase subunit II [Xanthobacteraceae bacterium]